jgi:glycosyltransferase involved in cell wall biosynthesis
MRVGLYMIDVAETVGGGHVLRGDVVQAALRVQDRHQIELVGLRPPMARYGMRRMRRALGRLTHLHRGPAAWQTQALADEARRKRIDILWFNNANPLDIGLPYIFNVFDVQHRLYPWFPEFAGKAEWDKRDSAVCDATRRASIVTVGSETVRQQINLFYGVPLERIHVVAFPTPQNAIDAATHDADTETERHRVCREYHIDGEFLFYPAQFWAHKNHVTLLRALSLLHQRHGMHIPLVLTGSDQGNLAHIRRVIGELGLTDSVHLLGFIPREDVIALYRGAFALVYMSFFGPENLPPLEAMALSCPVVLADAPGVRDLFGDAPVFVDARSEEAIASGVKRLRDDPELRRRCIATGREIALTNTCEEYVRRIHRLLDEFEPARRTWPASDSSISRTP